jgi:hypothetical protein
MARITMALSGALALSLTTAQAVTQIDLRTEIFNNIGSAVYLFDNTLHPSGTGVFGADSGGVFSTIQGPANDGFQQGYNTSTPDIMQNARTSTWNHEIQVSDLTKVTVSDIEYVTFLLDINEPADPKQSLITLDDVKIFTSSGMIAAATLTDLIGAGNLRYSMDVGETDLNTFVLLDFNRVRGGSGSGDMTLFVEASLFDFEPSDLNDYVYLYSRFGGDDASGLVGDVNTLANSGFEEWTVGTGAIGDDSGPNEFPEPSTGMLGALGLMMILRRRNR